MLSVSLKHKKFVICALRTYDLVTTKPALRFHDGTPIKGKAGAALFPCSQSE